MLTRHSAARGDRVGVARAAAFTLTELLVVVAVVVVLLALLLPVVGAVRRKARSVVCLSNLRQIGVAFQLYLTDNKGRPPNTGATPNAHGPLCVEPALVRDPRELDSGIMYCPEADDFGRPKNFGAYNFYLGTAFLAWGEAASNPQNPGPWTVRIKRSSYGMNAWVTAPPPLSGPGAGDPAFAAHFISARDAANSDVPLVGDAVYPNVAPMTGDPVPSNLLNPFPGGDGVNSWGTGIPMFYIARHGRAVNMVFAGGHARTVPLAELCKLKWSRTFVPREVKLPPA